MKVLTPFRALTLDVGGVFLVPRHERLRQALAGAGLDDHSQNFWDGHYAAMHAVDLAQSEPETFGDYVPAFCHHVGYTGAAHTAAVNAIQPLFGPSALWSEPIVESVDALGALVDAGIPMAVVSNADGTVADVLAGAAVLQAGPGPHHQILAVIDSGALGIAKPDPAIFDPALAALGVDAADVLHVGDSVLYDVGGARAAGLQATHFDPRQLCTSEDHSHLRSLRDLIPLWQGSSD